MRVRRWRSEASEPRSTRAGAGSGVAEVAVSRRSWSCSSGWAYSHERETPARAAIWVMVRRWPVSGEFLQGFAGAFEGVGAAALGRGEEVVAVVMAHRMIPFRSMFGCLLQRTGSRVGRFRGWR